MSELRTLTFDVGGTRLKAALLDADGAAGPAAVGTAPRSWRPTVPAPRAGCA